MSLIGIGAALVVGVLTGRFITGAWREREAKQARLAAKASEERAELVAAGFDSTTSVEGTHWPGVPAKVGDVILKTVGDEALLESALAFHEDDTGPRAVLFSCPGKGATYILMTTAPELSVWWLVEASAAPVLAEPPTTMEWASARYERKRRRPFRAERVGEFPQRDVGIPPVLVVAEYRTTSADRLLALAGEGFSRVFVGEELLAGTYEVIEPARTPRTPGAT